MRAAALGAAVVAAPACTKINNTSPASTPQLPPIAEAQAQAIFSKYGNRFSEEQKSELKRIIAQLQKYSEAIQAFPLDNSNEPAMIFRIYRSNNSSRGK